jgi:hypothetical protein
MVSNINSIVRNKIDLVQKKDGSTCVVSPSFIF